MHWLRNAIDFLRPYWEFLRPYWEEFGRRLRQRSTLQGLITFLISISVVSAAQGEAALDVLGWAYEVLVPFVREHIVPLLAPGGLFYALYEALRDDGSNH